MYVDRVDMLIDEIKINMHSELIISDTMCRLMRWLSTYLDFVIWIRCMCFGFV